MTDFPYPGLRPFQRNENTIFFGREQHIDQLITQLEQTHFLTVVGLSGCGKSSLIRAGLLADLETGFYASAGVHWQVAEMRPSHRPFTRLAEALLETTFRQTYMPDLTRTEASAFLQAELQRVSLLGLPALLQETPLPDDTNLLVFVDQFEEIFRYYQDVDKEEAEKFVALLLATSQALLPTLASNDRKKPHRVYVVITMRSDFIGNCALFQGLPEAINQSQFLPPRLTREQLREAIVAPARVFDGDIDDTLVNQLLNDAGTDFDQLPLLQHALMRMWTLEAKKSNQADCSQANSIRLSMTHYEEIGGWSHALSKHADEAYAELDLAQRKMAEILFRNLSVRDSNYRDMRRPIKLSVVATLANVPWQQIAEVVKVFRQEGRNFLMPPPDKILESDTVLDISHESLIRQWQRLKAWTEKEAESAEIYRRLETTALLKGKHKAELWTGIDLANALDWHRRDKPTQIWAKRYGKMEGRYFKRAMRFLAESEQTQKRAWRRTRQKRAGTIMGLMMIIILTVWGLGERGKAQLAQQIKYESFLTHATLSVQTEDYATAKTVLIDNPQLERLEKEVLAPRRHTRNLLAWFSKLMGGAPLKVYEGADAQLEMVAISPDGSQLVAGGENGTLVIFDTNTGQLQRLPGYQGTIVDAVFHPQGEWLATVAKDDKHIVFWTLSTRQQIKKWVTSGVRALAINAEGTYLASNNKSNIILWQIETGKPLRTLSEHKESIIKGGLVFHPSKSLLASASDDKTALLWNFHTGEKLHTFKPINNNANITFSPDGQYLVGGCYDKTVCLWDIDSGELWKMLQGHKNQVSSVRYVNNGRYLVSASLDRSLRLWDVESGVTLRVLQGHTAAVRDIATYDGQVFSASDDGTVKRWSTTLPYQHHIELPSEGAISTAIAPNGYSVAIGFKDGTLRLYSLPTFQLLWEQKQAHTKVIIRLAFSYDNRWLASASYDNTAKLWQLEKNQLYLQKPFIHPNKVYAVAFSPDSQTLATASGHGEIGLFSVATEQTTTRFIKQAHDGRVSSVEFDASGTRLVSGGVDGYTRLWNLNDEPPTVLQDFPTVADKIISTTISPDSQWVASVGRDQIVHIYATHDGQEQEQLFGYKHEESILGAVFSQDSYQIATVSADATVRFWDLSNGNALFTLRLPTNLDKGTPLWDFDFHCTAQNCKIAVPLYTYPKLMLYELGAIYANALQLP